MATRLNKTIKRVTESIVFERGKTRQIVVSIEPTRDGSSIGLKLLGNRDTYRIGTQSVLNMAIRHHQDKIERRTKAIMKAEGINQRSARARARKELAKELR
jgi:hypothetical protein